MDLCVSVSLSFWSLYFRCGGLHQQFIGMVEATHMPPERRRENGKDRQSNEWELKRRMEIARISHERTHPNLFSPYIDNWWPLTSSSTEKTENAFVNQIHMVCGTMKWSRWGRWWRVGGGINFTWADRYGYAYLLLITTEIVICVRPFFLYSWWYFVLFLKREQFTTNQIHSKAVIYGGTWYFRTKKIFENTRKCPIGNINSLAHYFQRCIFLSRYPAFIAYFCSPRRNEKKIMFANNNIFLFR